MGDLKHDKAVVQEVVTGEKSSAGNEYARVVLHNGLKVDFYHDDFTQELKDFTEEYQGLICDVFYEDRGYTVGKAIVPASSEKAGELLEKKIDDDFQGLSDEKKEELIDKVEKIFERERGDQEGLDSYET